MYALRFVVVGVSLLEGIGTWWQSGALLGAKITSSNYVP